MSASKKVNTFDSIRQTISSTKRMFLYLYIQTITRIFNTQLKTKMFTQVQQTANSNFLTKIF